MTVSAVTIPQDGDALDIRIGMYPNSPIADSRVESLSTLYLQAKFLYILGLMDTSLKRHGRSPHEMSPAAKRDVSKKSGEERDEVRTRGSRESR